MQEIETKILEINVEEVKKKLIELGAKLIVETKLVVDWYGPKGFSVDNQPWYLRIRTTTDGKNEVSWKSLPKIFGNTRHSDEVNISVSDAMSTKSLFENIGLENYAHQEKYRTSFVLKDWQFDIDQYPKMPAYLEIEGKSHEHIQEAIKILNLENHTSIGEGERKLISEKYQLDWTNMHF